MADATKRFLALGSLLSMLFAACTVASDSTSPTIQPTASPQPSAAAVRSLTPTIPPHPSNDDPPGIDIIELPFTDTTNNSRAQIHAMEPSFGDCGFLYQSVWYSFTAKESGTIVADTFGSDFDTVIHIWRGSLTDDLMDPGFESLAPLACNNDSGGTTQSEVVFNALEGERYVIRVASGLESIGGTLVFHLYR